ncbi:MAG: phosphatidate cytidylyltransferase [Albimonas sp.]|uniref:phosphatidate cytidylyltransferase n=1 Tax=Albimonas sp. TaxID=1872425 RepID=UPI0040576DE2
MAPGAPKARSFADLRARTLAGVAMAALAALALGLGGWIAAAFAAACAGGMGWELRRMTAGRFDGAGWAIAAAGVAASLATQGAFFRSGLAVAAACLIAALLLTRRDGAWARWATVIGGGYVAVACAGLVDLRDDPLYGWEAVLWVVLVVVATDVGAYFAGRIIGGPKLWPRVSPSKTWAGLGGGMACATAVGAIFSSATTGTLIHEVAIVSGVMAVVSQGGDLAESSLKRRAGVKDSSNLIPGHGGLLDRMDGLMAAALVAAILTFLRGKSVFIW